MFWIDLSRKRRTYHYSCVNAKKGQLELFKTFSALNFIAGIVQLLDDVFGNTAPYSHAFVDQGASNGCTLCPQVSDVLMEVFYIFTHRTRVSG